jgi:tetratricopeptide (TPR) repeat protein
VVQHSIKRALAAIALITLGGTAVGAQGQQKQWKDRAEYDLYESITKEQNANTRLGLLNSWKQKYAASDYADARQILFIQTYQALGNAKGMMDSAKELVEKDPKNFQGLYWMNLLTISMNDTSPAALDTGEKAGNALLGVIPETFDPAKKPANVADDVWKQERANMTAIAHRTLAWVAMTRNQNEVAEKFLTEMLRANPNDAQASSWMGTVLLKQRKIEKISPGLYHIAHAANHDGQGALPDAVRKSLQSYLEKQYINFRGDKEGLAEMIEMTKKSALPPDGFKIESKDELLAKQEEELKKTNPQLALWVNIKRALGGAEGAGYFDTNMKGAAIPGGAGGVDKFRCTAVATAPDKRPNMIICGISSPDMSEVTLRFEKPLAAPVPPGTELQFSGVPAAFTADPFMLTFDVEVEDVAGLPKPAPAAKKGGAGKKASKK